MDSEKNVLLILANYNFSDEEYELVRDKLLSNGVGIKVAAREAGMCAGTSGTEAEVDMSFIDINQANFDALIVIGGAGIDTYFSDEILFEVIRNFHQSNKIVGAISWAPVILAYAGVLTKKQATVLAEASKILEEAGALYTGEPVTFDGGIITASNSDYAGALAEKVIDFFKF